MDSLGRVGSIGPGPLGRLEQIGDDLLHKVGPAAGLESLLGNDRTTAADPGEASFREVSHKEEPGKWGIQN